MAIFAKKVISESEKRKIWQKFTWKGAIWQFGNNKLYFDKGLFGFAEGLFGFGDLARGYLVFRGAIWSGAIWNDKSLTNPTVCVSFQLT